MEHIGTLVGGIGVVGGGEYKEIKVRKNDIVLNGVGKDNGMKRVKNAVACKKL